VYFFYFASVGALMPYLGLYLSSIGLVAAQIGIVFAVMQGTRLIAPSMLAYLSARFNDRMRLIQLASFLTLIAFSLMLHEYDFTTILVLTFVFSFFWNAILSQFEAITLTMLATKTDAYSGIRLWGSVGFVVAVAWIGFVLEYVTLNNWPVLVSLCLLAMFVCSLLLAEKGRRKPIKKTSSLVNIIKQKQVIAFFAVVFLIQASHGPYYAFFSILLRDLNYSEAQIGQFWSLGVVAEVILFIVIHRVFTHISLRVVLLLSIFLTAVRWLMVAWLADNLAILLIAQLLHAASFGAFHVVCIQLTHQYFSGVHQDQGQALYSSIGFGAGGMLGGLMAGFLWIYAGEGWVFTLASLMSVLAFLIVWKFLSHAHLEELHTTGDAVSSI